MVRCPPGQHRNKRTGNCESCPPGTRRQGRKCVPVAVAPVPVVGPVAPLTIHWPPKPTRCPPGYNRSKHAPFNCEKCPVNTRRNTRTRMCDPPGAPVAHVPAVAPVPANPDISPLLVIPRAMHLKCSKGTRRNRRTGNCEGCPPNTRRIRNECHRVAPAHAAPVARAAQAAPSVRTADTLTYNGRLHASTNDREAELNAQAGRIITIVQHNDPLVIMVAVNETYYLIEHMSFQNVSIHVFMYFMERTLRLLFAARNTPTLPTLPEKLRSTYALLYKTFLEKTLQFSAESVNQVLMGMPRLNQILCAPDMFGNVRLGDELLDVFEDHGAYYRPNGTVHLKPAALMRLQPVVLPLTPMIACTNVRP